jgi:hypothetical protein
MLLSQNSNILKMLNTLKKNIKGKQILNMTICAYLYFYKSISHIFILKYKMRNTINYLNNLFIGLNFACPC